MVKVKYFTLQNRVGSSEGSVDQIVEATKLVLLGNGFAIKGWMAFLIAMFIFVL